AEIKIIRVNIYLIVSIDRMALHEFGYILPPVLHFIDIIDQGCPEAHFHREEEPIPELIFYPYSEGNNRRRNRIISCTRIQPIRSTITRKERIALAKESIGRIPYPGFIG